MRRSIAVLLVLFSFSFSNPREYFFIQGTPYVLRLNPDMTDSLSNGDFPERYDVLGRYIYKKYKNDLPEHTWKYTSEIALLSIKNDSLFIDSIRFSSIEAAVDLDVPLSKIFPDAKEKIFASWFSDTLRLNNDSCQKSEARNKIAPYETEYIIVFDKGRVVKKGMGTYSCIHLEWNMDSTYKELENFDSEDRNNPCRDVYFKNPQKYESCLAKHSGKRAKKKGKQPRNLPGLSRLYLPLYDSLYRLQPTDH